MTEREEHTHYLLGHTEQELERLDLQGALYRDVTRRSFEEAGIERGMRVLDIGCGTGDVSLTAAEVVGTSGAVLGIDRGADAVGAARRRAETVGVTQVTFEVSEIDAYENEAAHDALVGRFVLMHQSEPGRVLARAARAVRPGGRIVMIESYMQSLLAGAHSEPHSPLYDAIVRWKCAVVGAAGADLKAGGRLRSTFLEAGLPAPTTRLEARLEGGPDSLYYRYVAQSVRSMAPEALRQGIEGYSDSDADTIAERLRDEVVASDGVLVAWPVVVAWCEKP